MPDHNDQNHPPPLQFGISSLLWLMLGVGLIFGILRWLQVSVTTSLIIMGILLVGGLAVVFLAFAIAKVDDN
jgi:hypothetical protein